MPGRRPGACDWSRRRCCGLAGDHGGVPVDAPARSPSMVRRIRRVRGGRPASARRRSSSCFFLAGTEDVGDGQVARGDGGGQPQGHGGERHRPAPASGGVDGGGVFDPVRGSPRNRPSRAGTPTGPTSDADDLDQSPEAVEVVRVPRVEREPVGVRRRGDEQVGNPATVGTTDRHDGGDDLTVATGSCAIESNGVEGRLHLLRASSSTRPFVNGRGEMRSGGQFGQGIG